MRKIQLAALLIVLASFAIGAYLYPSLPDMIPTHWNFEGEVDGYMPKFWGVFMLPLMSLALLGILTFVPRIDPLKQNIAKFRSYYDQFILVMVAFFSYIFVLTLAWSMGFTSNFTQLMSPSFAIIFYFAGVMMEKTKRNWFIGLRTPWTLSDDRVWDKTNKLGGRIFKLSGILFVLGALIPNYGILFGIAVIIAGSIYTIVYSYVLYRKLKK